MKTIKYLMISFMLVGFVLGGCAFNKNKVYDKKVSLKPDKHYEIPNPFIYMASVKNVEEYSENQYICLLEDAYQDITALVYFDGDSNKTIPLLGWDSTRFVYLGKNQNQVIYQFQSRDSSGFLGFDIQKKQFNVIRKEQDHIGKACLVQDNLYYIDNKKIHQLSSKSGHRITLNFAVDTDTVLVGRNNKLLAYSDNNSQLFRLFDLNTKKEIWHVNIPVIKKEGSSYRCRITKDNDVLILGRLGVLLLDSHSGDIKQQFMYGPNEFSMGEISQNNTDNSKIYLNVWEKTEKIYHYIKYVYRIDLNRGVVSRFKTNREHFIYAYCFKTNKNELVYSELRYYEKPWNIIKITNDNRVVRYQLQLHEEKNSSNLYRVSLSEKSIYFGCTDRRKDLIMLNKISQSAFN